MSWTKRELIIQAFEELGLSGYDFDSRPEELNTALKRLDSLLAMWNAKGVRLGYTIPSSAEGSNLEDDSNLPDSANEAVITNLAIRIAPTIGKAASRDTKKKAKEAYSALLNLHTQPSEMSFPTTLPLGAGNKPWRTERDNYVNEGEDSILTGPDGELEFS